MLAQIAAVFGKRSVGGAESFGYPLQRLGLVLLPAERAMELGVAMVRFARLRRLGQPQGAAQLDQLAQEGNLWASTLSAITCRIGAERLIVKVKVVFRIMAGGSGTGAAASVLTPH
jgi:hypothetical protein